jgi:hypothetical protein
MAARTVGAGSGSIARATSGRALRRYALFVAALIVLFVADGSRQPTSGPGWRILGYQRGVVWNQDLVLITGQEELDSAWDRLLIRSDPPGLPSTAMTFWITATGRFGCPAHFAGLLTDPAAATVVLTFTLAITSGCDTMSVPDSFLLAIDRDRLPVGPIQLKRVGPDGEPDAVMQVIP